MSKHKYRFISKERQLSSANRDSYQDARGLDVLLPICTKGIGYLYILANAIAIANANANANADV